MKTIEPGFAQLSDRDLLAEVTRLAACEQQATADLIAVLAELDARRLYLAEGCASLFSYCVERLRLSEHAAYHRIEAARAVRRFPVILERLANGMVTLTAVTLLRPHLTDENHERLLKAAAGRSKRAVEVMVRGLAPLPDERASVRKLPVCSTAALGGSRCSEPDSTGGTIKGEPGTRSTERMRHASATRGVGVTAATVPLRLEASTDGALPPQAPGTVDRHPSAPPSPPRPAEVRPLSPTRYSLRVTLSADACAKLRRAQDLLRHAEPGGDPSAIVERALTLLVERLERVKCAARISRPIPAPSAARAEAPRGAGLRRSRHVPAGVRRAVWARDEGRCAFVGTGGRCTERGFLEFHHRIPFAEGGESTERNTELRCRAHNLHESRRWFGENDGCVRVADRTDGEPQEVPTRPGPS
jgi:hypothetical protein